MLSGQSMDIMLADAMKYSHPVKAGLACANFMFGYCEATR
jgi:hypothetical protein